MNWRAPYSPAPLARKPLQKAIKPHNSVMTIRTRKFFGTIALLLLALVWALTGMAVAQLPLLANSGWLQAIFYVVAGMGWVLPAMPIVSWMSRPRAG
jgi:apolipoprotein N-acyltransferase